MEGGNSDLFFVGGLSGATIVGGQGSDTYFGANGGSAGPQLIEGGSGGNNLLIAGNGAATLVGGGKGDQLMATGDADQLLIAGKGAETLSAAASFGNVTLIGGSGKDLMIGGLGNDTFVGGSGKSTVQASLGQNQFAFVNQGHDGAGTMLVTGILDASSIKINLEGVWVARGQLRADAPDGEERVGDGVSDGWDEGHVPGCDRAAFVELQLRSGRRAAVRVLWIVLNETTGRTAVCFDTRAVRYELRGPVFARCCGILACCCLFGRKPRSRPLRGLHGDLRRSCGNGRGTSSAPPDVVALRRFACRETGICPTVLTREAPEPADKDPRP